MSDVTNLASKFGLKIDENGHVVNLGAINTVTVDSLQAELTSLKVKYEKAVRCLKNFEYITPTNGPKNGNYSDAYFTLRELGEKE